MTKWAVHKREGLIVGCGLMVAIVAVDTGLIWLAVDRAVLLGAITIGTFAVGLAVAFSLGMLIVIGYWLYGLIRAEYLLDRNALVIRWGPVGQIVPMGSIKTVMYGHEVEGRIRMFAGGMWPGHCVGYGEVPGKGLTLFYGTEIPRHQIYVVTPALTYGVSPAEPETFFQSMVERIEMGPTQSVEQASRRPRFLGWDLWRDRVGLALVGVGFLALLALIGFVCYQYPWLPLETPLHFDAAGNPDRLGPRLSIFLIPLIGLLTLLANGVLGALLHRRERMASYLLWGGALLLQVLVWTAAVGVLRSL